MINISLETVIIILLIAFILGLIIGVSLARPDTMTFYKSDRNGTKNQEKPK